MDDKRPTHAWAAIDPLPSARHFDAGFFFARDTPCQGLRRLQADMVAIRSTLGTMAPMKILVKRMVNIGLSTDAAAHNLRIH